MCQQYSELLVAATDLCGLMHSRYHKILNACATLPNGGIDQIRVYYKAMTMVDELHARTRDEYASKDEDECKALAEQVAKVSAGIKDILAKLADTKKAIEDVSAAITLLVSQA